MLALTTLRRFVATAAFLVMLIISAKAETTNFGPFAIDDAMPDVIRMTGEIDAGAALNFRRALTAAP